MTVFSVQRFATPVEVRARSVPEHSYQDRDRRQGAYLGKNLHRLPSHSMTARALALRDRQSIRTIALR